MAYKTPNEGGCWFCQGDEGPMLFSFEFDTYFHEECLRKSLETDNPEATIIYDEYKEVM